MGQGTGVRVGAGIVGAIFVVLVFGLLIAGCSGGWQSGKPGEVGVERNGAFWNGSGIRGTIAQGSSLQWVGVGTSIHFYPAGNVQRYYTISSNSGEGDRPGVDVVHVPTGDGIQVGIEGTIYFHDAFDGTSKGNNLVRDFDTQFGVRTFPEQGKQGSYTHAYSGDTGWESFLDAVVRPVIDNELRQAIGSTRCAELVSSCALVTNNGGSKKQIAFGNVNTQANIQKVQDAVNAGLLANLNKTLGEPYFAGISFRLSRVALPGSVQDAIATAQASFAQVTQQQALVNQAKLIAKANEEKQRAYARCPVCGQIDELKVLPTGATVFFGVGKPSITVPVK